jgi:uncharacterized protein YfaP (DUF2135 family)
LNCINNGTCNELGECVCKEEYNGTTCEQITSDELEKRLERVQAKTGDIRVSLAWNNINDLDLFIIEPSGEKIFSENKKSASGGEFDIDMNADSPRSEKPIENIFWANGGPHGQYKVLVRHYANHGGSDPTNYIVITDFYGNRTEYHGNMTFGDEAVLIMTYGEQCMIFFFNISKIK